MLAEIRTHSCARREHVGAVSITIRHLGPLGGSAFIRVVGSSAVRIQGWRVGLEQPVEEGEPLGKVGERLRVMHGVVHNLQVEPRQLGQDAQGVAID